MKTKKVKELEYKGQKIIIEKIEEAEKTSAYGPKYKKYMYRIKGVFPYSDDETWTPVKNEFTEFQMIPSFTYTKQTGYVAGVVGSSTLKEAVAKAKKEIDTIDSEKTHWNWSGYY